jgi:hypothetical protein
MRNHLFFFVVLAVASTASTLPRDATCARWEVADLAFEATSDIADPFDLVFGAVFRHEGGRELTIPGFFDGGRRWVVRFAPPAEGRWAYRTFSSRSDLAGLSGEARVTASTKPGRHGALVVSPANRRRFAYEDGTPHFALAFEIDWLFALDHDNATDIPRTRQIVGHIAEHGFNQVVMNVYAFDANWGERAAIRPEHNFARPDVFPYGGTNEVPDHRTLNVGFFQHLDRVIAHLHEREIIAHLMIYVWNKHVNWARPYSREDNLYFDYVVKRYQAFPNLVWDISKEALAYGRDDINYITERIDRLRRLDGHGRLVTVHDYHYCRTFPEKVDFISVQEWRPNLYDEMLEVARRHENKPVLNIEHGGYESARHTIFRGAYTDPLVCLERNYQCAFAGVYSTYYWQHTSWYEVVYNPFDLPPAEQPNFRYYRHLAGLFQTYDYNRLQPRQYLFSPYCLADDEKMFLFYLPRGMVALEGMAPSATRGRKVGLKWFDPLTGAFTAGETRQIPDSSGAWMGFRVPDSMGDRSVVAVMEVLE